MYFRTIYPVLVTTTEIPDDEVRGVFTVRFHGEGGDLEDDGSLGWNAIFWAVLNWPSAAW